MEFSTEFVTLRDRLQQATDPAFSVRRDAEIAGRTAALFCAMNMESKRKMFGLVSTGLVSHAHEFRLLFAAPQLDAAALGDWWEYACRVERELVPADDTHEFSIVSLVLATGAFDAALQRQLKKLSHETHYPAPQRGWSEVRAAVVDLSCGEMYSSRTGGALINVLQADAKRKNNA